MPHSRHIVLTVITSSQIANTFHVSYLVVIPIRRHQEFLTATTHPTRSKELKCQLTAGKMAAKPKSLAGTVHLNKIKINSSISVINSANLQRTALFTRIWFY